jgi:molybdenum cofactor cytidylyltransferase
VGGQRHEGPMNRRPAIIVVAAGRASRYRGHHHKLLENLGTTSVLGMTLRHVVQTQLPVVVVTTEALAPHAARVVALRDVVVVPDAGSRQSPELGMGYSIAAGVAARGNAQGWLVLPADMPLVLPATIAAVAAALGDHSVVVAQHRGQRGHPVGFSPELYSELVSLSGDDGAKRIVARYPAHPVEVDDPGVNIDIDTEDDLRAVRSHLARSMG